MVGSMPKKWTRYTYDDAYHPEVESKISADDTALTEAAGFDPNDEEVTVAVLTQPWNGHPRGAWLVGGLAVQNHEFAVEQHGQDSSQRHRPAHPEHPSQSSEDCSLPSWLQGRAESGVSAAHQRRGSLEDTHACARLRF